MFSHQCCQLLQVINSYYLCAKFFLICITAYTTLFAYWESLRFRHKKSGCFAFSRWQIISWRSSRTAKATHKICYEHRKHLMKIRSKSNWMQQWQHLYITVLCAVRSPCVTNSNNEIKNCWSEKFLGAFAKLRKVTIICFMFVCLPVRIDKLGSRW